MLALLTVGTFCLLTVISTPDKALVAAEGTVKVPFAEASISFLGFVFVAPFLLAVVSVYLHIFYGYWLDAERERQEHNRILPEVDKKPVEPVPMLFALGDPVSRGLTFFILYWLTPVVLAAITWTGVGVPSLGPPLFLVFCAVASALIFLRIRRSPEPRRRYPNMLRWLLLVGVGLSPVYFLHDAERLRRPLDLFRVDLTNAYLVRQDLRGATLAQAKLTGAVLNGANLHGVNLEDANLQGARLVGADLGDASLNEANLQEANLMGATLLKAGLRKANLGRANLPSATFDGAELLEANFEGANASWARFVGAKLPRVKFQKANLSHAAFERADLEEANFEEANLRLTFFTGAKLAKANFRGADLQQAAFYRDRKFNDEERGRHQTDLQGVNFQGANLRDCYLGDANLQGANFKGADLRKAQLFDANLQEADFEAANLQDADLRWSDLRTVKHLTAAQVTSARTNAETKLPDPENFSPRPLGARDTGTPSAPLRGDGVGTTPGSVQGRSPGR